jgi:hypothetical protein
LDSQLKPHNWQTFAMTNTRRHVWQHTNNHGSLPTGACKNIAMHCHQSSAHQRAHSRNALEHITVCTDVAILAGGPARTSNNFSKQQPTSESSNMPCCQHSMRLVSGAKLQAAAVHMLQCCHYCTADDPPHVLVSNRWWQTRVFSNQVAVSAVYITRRKCKDVFRPSGHC